METRDKPRWRKGVRVQRASVELEGWLLLFRDEDMLVGNNRPRCPGPASRN